MSFPHPPRAARAGLIRLAKLDADLAGIEPAAGPLPWRQRPDGFPGRAVDGWLMCARLALLDWAPTASIRLLTELGTWLRNHAVPDRHIGLLHNDYLINGSKWLITGASGAAFTIIMAMWQGLAG